MDNYVLKSIRYHFYSDKEIGFYPSLKSFSLEPTNNRLFRFNSDRWSEHHNNLFNHLPLIDQTVCTVRTWITWEQTPWHWVTRSPRYYHDSQLESLNLKMRLRFPVNIFSVKCKVVDRAVNRTFPSHWIIFAFIIDQIFRFSCGHSTQGSWLVIFLQVKILDIKLTKQQFTGEVKSDQILTDDWSRIDQF